MNSNPIQNLTDKNGNPLKGAALQARLTALQKKEIEIKAREYLQTNPISCWNEIDTEDKIQILVSLNNLIEDSSPSDINIQTIDQQTQIKWAELPIFQLIKASGYLLAIAGGTILLFLTIKGGEISDVKEAGTTLGAGIALIKFCYDQEDTEK
ncbi:hypothetical protein NG799_01565 [Laspinema sp. D1]|uniref:Uncharacterized protein n=2 Tax=Laspinema TaxID=2584823 RepID=A0ABT2MJU5_9CYAN|nr:MULTISPECIES: hypothetical protein [unclassified Laspinema]MCT7965019.1 hypothetical protein [Laspinema sp. D2a]MCT7977696.1 hypothetical protein [Laspinema sp. D3b]MCT7992542.1 hypothetical protein [Laspinema sp. D3c]